MNALLLCLATVAQFDEPTFHHQEPRYGFELKLGPYRPAVGDADEKAYYALVYGRDQNDSLFTNQPLMTTAEANWYFFRKAGLLGATFSVGYWNTKAPSRKCGEIGCTPETVGSSTRGQDKTSLTIVPFGLGLVYRFDLIKNRFRYLPFVPYAKGGVDYYLWRNTVRDKVSTGSIGRGTGGTWGAHATAGLALNLDFLEPNTAARARTSTGITDSYLFFEAAFLFANSFGDAQRFDMTDQLYQAGLAIDLF